MNKKILLAAAILMMPVAAFAQNTQDAVRGKDASVAGPASAPAASVGTASRDGCVNQPGVPHNSADCSRVPASDSNTARNDASRDLAGRPTGATENAARNDRILSGQSQN
jgi:hypothetical protein